MSEKILLAHGAGGTAYRDLIEQVIKPELQSVLLDTDNDSAVLPVHNIKIAMTTDSFVIKPLFFPGGDIGRLAVCGTVNDLAVSGAKPLYLTSSFIIEEGFPIEDLKIICSSMSRAAKEAEVHIVTGDTKVVPKGACDGIYINTAGVGILNECVLPARIPQKGDLVLCSGNLGEHEAVIAALRDGTVESFSLCSDVAPINHAASALFDNVPVLAMRDPTRGGIASVLNEFAEKFNIVIELEEQKLPISSEVRAISSLYGYDPLHMSNEGKFVSIIPADCSETAINILKRFELCKNSCICGHIADVGKSALILRTKSGGRRLITVPAGELLPRIC